MYFRSGSKLLRKTGHPNGAGWGAAGVDCSESEAPLEAGKLGICGFWKALEMDAGMGVMVLTLDTDIHV